MKHHHLYTIERRNARLQVRAIEVQIAHLTRHWDDERKFEKLKKLEEMQKGIIRAYSLNGEISPITSIDKWINFKTPGIYLRIPLRRVRTTLHRITTRNLI